MNNKNMKISHKQNKGNIERETKEQHERGNFERKSKDKTREVGEIVAPLMATAGVAKRGRGYYHYYKYY